MDLINKIGKSMATYRHDPRQFPVDQVKLTSIEPESAAVSTVVHDDVCAAEKPNGCKLRLQTPRAILGSFFCNLGLFLRTELDGACDLKRHFVQLAPIEPQAAAFLTNIVRQFSVFGDDIVVRHLLLTI
jgi:hypothetical protein